jgi:hypothetical protein
MRTTIQIDDQLLRDAKAHPERLGCSLTALVEDALRQMLDRQAVSPRRDPVRLITVSGRGLRPGIDLDDSAKLLNILEQADGPD